MNDIAALRREIDAIDEDLVRLFIKRLGLMRRVAEAKRTGGLAVCDPAREKEILDRVATEAGADYAESAVKFFSTLFDISKARQRTILDTGNA